MPPQRTSRRLEGATSRSSLPATSSKGKTNDDEEPGSAPRTTRRGTRSARNPPGQEGDSSKREMSPRSFRLALQARLGLMPGASDGEKDPEDSPPQAAHEQQPEDEDQDEEEYGQKPTSRRNRNVKAPADFGATLRTTRTKGGPASRTGRAKLVTKLESSSDDSEAGDEQQPTVVRRSGRAARSNLDRSASSSAKGWKAQDDGEGSSEEESIAVRPKSLRRGLRGEKVNVSFKTEVGPQESSRPSRSSSRANRGSQTIFDISDSEDSHESNYVAISGGEEEEDEEEQDELEDGDGSDNDEVLVRTRPKRAVALRGRNAGASSRRRQEASSGEDDASLEAPEEAADTESAEDSDDFMPLSRRRAVRVNPSRAQVARRLGKKPPTRAVYARLVEDLPMPIVPPTDLEDNAVLEIPSMDAERRSLYPEAIHNFPIAAMSADPEAQSFSDDSHSDSGDNQSDFGSRAGSSSENVSELDELKESEDETEVDSDTESAIEPEPKAAVDKHWDTCRKCGDKPALPMYKQALIQEKRMEMRKRRRSDPTESPVGHSERKRMYRKGMFDEGAVEDTPEQRMIEWKASLEDRGGWLQCPLCSVSSHWGCLNSSRQKEILAPINAEARALHNTFAKESDEPFVPRKGLDLHEKVDFALCPECQSSKWSCMVCKTDGKGQRITEIDENGVEAPIEVGDDFPAPPENLSSSILFRCKRCRRCSHYECMKSSREGQAAEEKAEIAQKSDWQCDDCRRWPNVDQILAWRPLGGRESFDPDAGKRSYPLYSPKDDLKREYLVKFQEISFRKMEWVPHAWLSIVASVRLKVFLAHGTRIELEPAALVESQRSSKNAKSLATMALGGAVGPRRTSQRQPPKKMVMNEVEGVVDTGPPRPEPDAQQRIPIPWKTPDRILTVRYFASLEKDEDQPGGEEIKDENLSKRSTLDPKNLHKSWAHISRMLVKWQDLGYERCTWETLPTRRSESDIFDDYLRAYKAFLSARQIAIPNLTVKQLRERELRDRTPFVALADQPDCIRGGTLLDFQVEGVNWLRYGWHCKQPGILADEMGLGKTVQVISFIGSLWEEHKASPVLIVVPNSTITNWLREFEKWLPHLRVVPYFGQSDARRTIEKYELFHHSQDPRRLRIKAHVVVASDSSVRLDSLPLRKVGRWEMLIVDEGQNLKSGESHLFHRLNELEVEHRIIMTGTPLNNNIGELFNLLNWLQPGGEWKEIKELKKRYEVLTPELIEELQPRLKPYFLRRIKAEVLDLPPKTELIVPSSMRPIQKRIYRSILENNIEDIQALSEGKNMRKGKKKAAITNLNNVLMQLRKCIQHPYLIAPDLETKEGEAGYEASWEHQRLVDASAKLCLLQRLLPKLKARGHRVLLFSQFVINLDIVEGFLEEEGYKFLRLDGSVGTKQRQKGIDAFNAENSEYFIYLLSTRAGGVGINLATADTVIIFDPDFNPHVDMQAIARAHRIGQTKKVLVFTLILKGTAEEQIIETAKKKMVLDHLIVQNLNNEEDRPETLESILKFGAQALFDEGGLEENEKDIKYTDEDLDALLDRSEKDETFEINGRKEGGSDGRFSFARVWEKKEVAEPEQPAIPGMTAVDDDFWADLLENHRKALKKKEAEEEAEMLSGRRKRKATMKSSGLVVSDNESSPKAERKGKQIKKGKGKKGLDDADEDLDFILAPSGSDTDEEVKDGSTVAESISDLREKKKAARSKGVRAYQIPFNMGTNSVQAAPQALNQAQAPGQVSSAAASGQANAANLIVPPRFDGSRPVTEVTKEQAVFFGTILQAMPPKYMEEIKRRASRGAPHQLPPPHMSHQLTMTHAHYFSSVFHIPLVLFPQAFNIIPEESIPPEIRALPYGGAVALSADLVQEILVRTAFYMFLACMHFSTEQKKAAYAKRIAAEKEAAKAAARASAREATPRVPLVSNAANIKARSPSIVHVSGPEPAAPTVPAPQAGEGSAPSPSTGQSQVASSAPPPAATTTPIEMTKEEVVKLLVDPEALKRWKEKVDAFGNTHLNLAAEVTLVTSNLTTRAEMVLAVEKKLTEFRSGAQARQQANASQPSGAPATPSTTALSGKRDSTESPRSESPSSSPRKKAKPGNAVTPTLSQLRAAHPLNPGSPARAHFSKHEMNKLSVTRVALINQQRKNEAKEKAAEKAAEMVAEKAAEKAKKDAEKAAKQAEKDAEKAARDAEKAASAQSIPAGTPTRPWSISSGSSTPSVVGLATHQTPLNAHSVVAQPESPSMGVIGPKKRGRPASKPSTSIPSPLGPGPSVQTSVTNNNGAVRPPVPSYATSTPSSAFNQARSSPMAFTPTSSLPAQVGGGNPSSTSVGRKSAAGSNKCLICLGSFHFINKCPIMTDINQASDRLLQMKYEYSNAQEKDDNLRRTLIMMSKKVNAYRASLGLAAIP
ncbi:hypothetical protein IE53DRAFT_380642 [Violaceomyces palustris]|uniref:Uncharacterized protein n=1 Tax=Violaceomyces palustris TaxID=1673888 RepID=A0ACD0NU43_9BASI|nr:hypothetical protein IE53DRAFT_380642 [Violaceomyces palustris]